MARPHAYRTTSAAIAQNETGGSNRMPQHCVSKGRHSSRKNQALRRLRTLPHSRCRLHPGQRCR